MKTKAAQIAAYLNERQVDYRADYRKAAESKADELGVGLYWAGTAAPAPALPSAEVWQIRNGAWIRCLGVISLGFDNNWRASA